MDSKFGIDLTTGSVPRHLLVFSIPMLIGNLARTSYNIINIIWVGHLVGKDAVGAAGVSFPILFVLIGVVVGMSIATSILVAQYYGAKKFNMVEKVVNNSFLLSLVIGAFFTIIGILLSDFFLRLMETPPENFAMASSYLKLNLAGFIMLYLAFLINSILRGIGDTKIPLIFTCISMGMNVILDPFFIGGFGPFPLHGLDGAAYATLISQATSLAISIVYLNKKNQILAFNPRKFILDKHITFMLFKIGIPSVVQQSLITISTLFITTFVNAFGSAATNAFGAVGRIDMFVFLPAMFMGMAVSTITGQNLGAGKSERVKEVFKWGVVFSSSATIFISLIIVVLSKPILIMFGLGNDVNVMDIGIAYLRIVGSCYVFMSIVFISNGIINGAGHTIITMVFTLFSLWIIRVPFSWLLSKTSLGITGIWVAESLSFVLSMIVSLTYYFSGRWHKAVIGHNICPGEVVKFVK